MTTVMKKITPASTPNIIENDDDSDDNGDNNYDDDYDDDDYDDDAYTDTKALLMMLIAYDSGHLDPARMLHIIRLAFGPGVFRSSIVGCSISFSLIMVRPRSPAHGSAPP